MLRFARHVVLLSLLGYTTGLLASAVPSKHVSAVTVDHSYQSTSDCTSGAVSACDGGTYGVDRFATVQAGIDAVRPHGTVTVHPGTYRENLTISKSLTLVGTSFDAMDTVLSGFAGNTVHITAGDVTLEDLSLQGSTGTESGLYARGFGRVTLTNVHAVGNNGHGFALYGGRQVSFTDVHATGNDADGNGNGSGIELQNVGEVIFAQVQANQNAHGLRIDGASSFRDTDGMYTQNDTHGIHLASLSGDVALLRTTLENNDADNDNLGDGLNASSSNACTTAAIGGNLLVQGATIRDTDGSGTGAFQERGVHVECITGTVTMESSADPFSMTVFGHDAAGVWIAEGASDVHITDGDYTFNSLDGLYVQADGTVNVNTINASNNRVGLRITDASEVTVKGGSFMENSHDGIVSSHVAATHFVDAVIAAGNGKSGATIRSGNTFTDTDGVFMGNRYFGLRIAEVETHVALNGTVANNNADDTDAGHGIDISNSGDVTALDVMAMHNTHDLFISNARSFKDTNGVYSTNVDDLFISVVHGGVTWVRTPPARSVSQRGTE